MYVYIYMYVSIHVSIYMYIMLYAIYAICYTIYIHIHVAYLREASAMLCVYHYFAQNNNTYLSWLYLLGEHRR